MDDALGARLDELRRSFDEAFAEARRPPREGGARTLLAIRVGREPHAVLLGEVAALEVRRAVTPVPSEHPELLGIAGVRGAIVAVFDLAALVGAASGEAPWLLLAKGAPVAFAFAELDGVISVSGEALASSTAAPGGSVREVISRQGQPLPVIDIAGLVRQLERRPAPEDGKS